VLFDYDNPDVITGGHDTKRVYAVTLDTKPSVANYAPVITDLSDVVVTVGDTINISLAATDPDVGDVLTYTADVLPSGISIVNNVLVGNYGAEETLTTTITVADDSGIGGTDTDTTTMMFTVVGVGRSLVTSTVDYANLSPDSPLIDAISDGDFEVGDQLDFPAIVDGRTVFFGSDGLITVSGVGDVTIPDIYIRDKSNSYDRVGPFSITLAEVVVNSAPVITSGGSVSVVAGSSTTYTAAATDSNGDAIAFSIANSPAWVSISGTTVSIDASAQSAGSYSFDLVASDGNGGSVSQTVTIAVTAVADTTAPVITVAGGTTAMTVGGVYTPPMVTALDNVDGDITGSIVTTGTAVNPSVAGTYTLIYNVVDGAGTPALQKTHTVVVSPAVVVSDPVRLVIDGDNTLIDLKGELLTHTYADWFVTDSDIDATNKAGSALNIVATGELLEVVDGVGAVQVAGPVVGNVYTLVVYTIPPGQSQPTHYQRVMLTAQAVA
jgi:hypothetical protein